jgi:hypothetical protein
MVEGTAQGDDSRDRDRDRVAQEMTGRLTTRGVEVRDSDGRDDVTRMADAVERFEEQVSALGGDLMVDEPPTGHEGRPDDERFRLPLRRADESAAAYARRLDQASDELRKYRRDL